jgi:SAM-dependent methyltransferase
MDTSPIPHSDFHCAACLGTIGGLIGSKHNFALRRCTNCATVTVDPFPTPEEIVAFYKSYTGTTDYTKKEASKIRRCTKRIGKFMAKAPGREFLDVGCNYGFGVAAASQLGLSAEGIDIDSTAVASCNARYADKGKFTAMTVQDFADSGAKKDMLYTSEVIEHVLDPNSFVAALAHILRVGGRLYLTTPDGAHFSLPKKFEEWEAVIPPEHLTYFSRKGMKILLERHGFTHVSFKFNLKPGIIVQASKAA